MKLFETCRHWAFVAWASLLLGACGGGGSEGVIGVPASAVNKAPVEGAERVGQVEGYKVAGTAEVQKSQQPRPDRTRPTPARVRLGPVEVAKTAAPSKGAGVPVQIGLARAIPETASAQGMRGKLAIRLEDGFTSPAGAVSFTSTGASAIRLGLLVTRLPPAARVRGYTQAGEVAFDVSGQEILAGIRRNRDAGDLSDEGRTWWTPTIENEEATLEISIPPGTSADEVEVSVPLLSHIVVKKSDLESFKAIGDSQSCEVDVTCRPEAEDASLATARMTWVSGGRSFACTGTLMADSLASGTPYFLSANHCISTQTSASSLITYWFYRASSCNSGVLSPAARQVNGGAVLLYASAATDTSFMRLNGAPPAGAAFSGWSAAAVALGQPVAAIHHPQADLQKFSQGQIVGYRNCTLDAATPLSCSVASGSGRFLATRWAVGTTEAGSSGSGLFYNTNGSSYLVGQLTGGNATCQRADGNDAYGRFDLAYAEALSRWLSPAAPVTPRDAIYRFYNAATGAHFFTRSAAERDFVIAGNAAFNYEGVAYYAYGSPVANSSPVYRFYNRRTGKHFYTIGEGERDYVASNPEYDYEGVSWYAQGGPGGDASAIYRFYNGVAATHFYTISSLERDYVVQTLPDYRLEGVGYYAWTTP